MRSLDTYNWLLRQLEGSFKEVTSLKPQPWIKIIGNSVFLDILPRKTKPPPSPPLTALPKELMAKTNWRLRAERTVKAFTKFYNNAALVVATHTRKIRLLAHSSSDNPGVGLAAHNCFYVTQKQMKDSFESLLKDYGKGYENKIKMIHKLSKPLHLDAGTEEWLEENLETWNKSLLAFVPEWGKILLQSNLINTAMAQLELNEPIGLVQFIQGVVEVPELDDNSQSSRSPSVEESEEETVDSKDRYEEPHSAEAERAKPKVI